MSQQATIRIPLVEAFFCEDCNSICNSPVQCECGSQALMSMSGVLNRETPGEPERLDGVYDPVIPFTTCDACWCAPGIGPAHPNCPMHGEVTA